MNSFGVIGLGVSVAAVWAVGGFSRVAFGDGAVSCGFSIVAVT